VKKIHEVQIVTAQDVIDLVNRLKIDPNEISLNVRYEYEVVASYDVQEEDLFFDAQMRRYESGMKRYKEFLVDELKELG